MPGDADLTQRGRSAAVKECDLKICDLCGWINAEANDECFVCGWRGHFERDPSVVHAAVELALRGRAGVELGEIPQGDGPVRRSRIAQWWSSLGARLAAAKRRLAALRSRPL